MGITIVFLEAGWKGVQVGAIFSVRSSQVGE